MHKKDWMHIRYAIGQALANIFAVLLLILTVLLCILKIGLPIVLIVWLLRHM